MIVVFISLSEKKSRLKTAQVLDMYANRIGPTTWKTNITLEGLKVVKAHLCKTASKNTSVACHWLHKIKESELLWIVGSKLKYTVEGIVPIATTSKNLLHNEWENKDHYLPLIKCIVALSALFHDLGKASDGFQGMLKNKKKSDIIRHEYISMFMFQSFIKNNDDKPWLSDFASPEFDEVLIKQSSLLKEKGINIKSDKSQFSNLVLIISYLIISHHRMPFIKSEKKDKEYLGEGIDNWKELFQLIDDGWGYHKTNDKEYINSFSNGINFSDRWTKEVKKWSNKLLNQLDLFESIDDERVLFLLVKKARLYLMLGDYYFSSKDKDEKYTCKLKLYANTCSDREHKGKVKQFLEEHLLGVEKEALQAIYTVNKSSSQLLGLENAKALTKKSNKDSKFYWQDKIAAKLKNIEDEDKKENGFFCVNLASTGTGKTFANAKILNAISSKEEDVRFNIALGLRSLTLQTGDMYRNKMHIDNTDLAVVIGSSAIDKLHNLEKNESVFDLSSFDDIDYGNIISDVALSTVIKSDKDMKFLCAPLCVSTIDHLIPASENYLGGRWIVPFLRLSTSDLIIDEIDDFVFDDLIAIAHLVYLAGMLGRRVLISSATITPSISKGYYKAYSEGWAVKNAYNKSLSPIITCFVDEFSNSVFKEPKDLKVFEDKYQKFINKRIVSLQDEEAKNGIKRKGTLIDFSLDDSKEEVLYKMIESSIVLHKSNNVIDAKSNKCISFGLVRFAHIDNCIDFAGSLNNYNCDDTDIFYLCYHSRNILLVRNEIENYLDKVLYRKDEVDTFCFTDNTIRSHIDRSKKDNIIFMIISSPIEEVGRDHDFDWAIVEPSSVRSIIQLAGRVLRHRKKICKSSNIAILQYNLNSLKNDDNAVFNKPGYEQGKDYKLSSHNMYEIIDNKELNKSINSIPRLKQNSEFNHNNSLINIEHESIKYSLLNEGDGFGPENLNGYYKGFWALTGLPMIYARFRNGVDNKRIYCFYTEDEFNFYERDDYGHFIAVNETYNIEFIENEKTEKMWLELDYRKVIDSYCERMNLSSDKVERVYSFIEVPNYLLEKKALSYSVRLGLNRR
jgi:CRISPR-associated endonuclease/helicase Cas3